MSKGVVQIRQGWGGSLRGEEVRDGGQRPADSAESAANAQILKKSPSRMNAGSVSFKNE